MLVEINSKTFVNLPNDFLEGINLNSQAGKAIFLRFLEKDVPEIKPQEIEIKIETKNETKVAETNTPKITFILDGEVLD